jgi:hypothetical protein
MRGATERTRIRVIEKLQGGTVDADAVMLVQTSTPATPIKKSAEGSTHQVLGQALASVDTRFCLANFWAIW